MPEKDPDSLRDANTDNPAGAPTDDEITLIPVDGEGGPPIDGSAETVLSLQLADDSGQPPRKPPVATGFGDEDGDGDPDGDTDGDTDDVDDLLHHIGGSLGIDHRPVAEEEEESVSVFTPVPGGELVGAGPAPIGAATMVATVRPDHSELVMNALMVTSLVSLTLGAVAVSATLQGLSPRDVLPWIF